MAARAGVRDVALLRIAAQRLAGPGFGSPAETVRWLTAVQAQDFPGAVASVALRTAGGSRARRPLAVDGSRPQGSVEPVRAALDEGSVVRSWPMRGTLHLLAAEDLRWMLPRGAARVATATARRRTELGLDGPTLARAEALTLDALGGGRRLPRAGLIAAWQEGGLITEGQRAAHLLGAQALAGLVCFGPTEGRAQAIVLAEEWLPPGPGLRSAEEELGEWALRYFRGHGPATVADFAWWSGLTVADVRSGLAVARAELEELEIDGVTAWMDPGTPDRLAACRAQARGVLLLPAFDELLLGYRDRSAVLDPAYANRLVPGGNGMFKASVVAGGKVVATWRRPPRVGARPAVTPFTTLGRGVEAAVERRWASWPVW